MMGGPKNWGATDAERARRYPCDGFAFAADDWYFRALDVAAPPALVFRWLCQLRAAPYSYDLIDNFGRRSPPQLVAGLDALAVGQRVMLLFEIVAFARPQSVSAESATPESAMPASDAPASLTIALRSRVGAALMGDLCGTYDVRRSDTGSRLLAKVGIRYPRGAYGALLRRPMPYLDLLMFRKQLLTLRRYAERDARIARASTRGASTA
ncbi:MAG: hypothetical protein NVSMB21_08860 [Vulcanimicrobiaceae bacterium]